MHDEKYVKLLEQASKLVIMQVDTEILDFMTFLDNSIKINRFLEIGSYQGASFYLWAKLAQEGSLNLSIDMPNGRFGHPQQRQPLAMAAIKQRIESIKPNTRMFMGSSGEKYVHDWVIEQLNGEPLDFLFIDADHTYDGVKQDYLNYSQLVRPGGIIGIHDISDTERHRLVGCTVHNFWKELEGDKTEFINGTVDWGGIGAIRKESI